MYCCADHNIEIAVTVERQITDRAGIKIASAVLQFFNDLHRTQFRCPGDGSARKGCFQKIHNIFIFRKSSLNFRYQMKDRRIRLDAVHFRHFDAARHTDTVQIISLQINDHKKFALILIGLFQFFSHRCIFFSGGSAFSGTFDRSGRHNTVTHLQETLRRRTDDLQIPII